MVAHINNMVVLKWNGTLPKRKKKILNLVIKLELIIFLTIKLTYKKIFLIDFLGHCNLLLIGIFPQFVIRYKNITLLRQK